MSSNLRREAARLPFVPSSTDYVLRKAKQLRKAFPHLSAGKARETTARALGFRNWHEVEQIAHTVPTSQTDDLIHLHEKRNRLYLQSIVLTEFAGVPSKDAHDFVALWNLTGPSRGGPVQETPRATQSDVSRTVERLRSAYDIETGEPGEQFYETFLDYITPTFSLEKRHDEEAELEAQAWRDSAVASSLARIEALSFDVIAGPPEDDDRIASRLAVLVFPVEHPVSSLGVVGLDSRSQKKIFQAVRARCLGIRDANIRVSPAGVVVRPKIGAGLPLVLLREVLQGSSQTLSGIGTEDQKLTSRSFVLVGVVIDVPRNSTCTDPIFESRDAVDVAISVPALSFEASSCSFVGSALEALAYATLGDDNFTRLNSLTATALRDNRAIRLTRIAAASSLLDVPAYGIQIEMETGIALEHGELKFAADCGASTLRTLSWLLNYFQEIPLEVSLVDCAPATVSKTPDELDRNRAEVFFASASEEVQLASREASDPTDAWLALQSAHALALLHERCMKDAGKCSRYCEFVSTRLSEAAPRPGESEGRMVFAVLVSGHTQHVPSFLPLSNAVRDRLAGACRSHFQVSRDIFVSPLAVLIPGGLPVWDEGCFDEARRALCGVVETSEIDEGVEVPGGMPGALAILMSATLEDSQRLANAILEKDDSFQPSLPRVGTFISSGNPAALLLPDVLITALSFLEDEPCLKSLEEDAIQRVWLDVVRGEEIPGVFNISVTIYRETGDIVKGSGVSAVPAFWVNHLRKLLDARGIRLEVRYAG